MGYFDIGSTKLSCPCPNCKSKISITLGGAIAESSVKCTVCGKTIELTDKDGSVKQSVESVNKEIANLDKQLKKLAKINIDFSL